MAKETALGQQIYKILTAEIAQPDPPSQEVMEYTAALFLLLQDQQVLHRLVLADELLRDNPSYRLTKGRRDDRPKAVLDESVYLEISSPRFGSPEYTFSLRGVISLTLTDNNNHGIPYEKESKVYDWVTKSYTDYTFDVAQQEEIGGCKLGIWNVSLHRQLDDRSLALSHGSRIQQMFQELENILNTSK